MKHILLIFLIALFLGCGITFLLFPEQKDVLAPVREQYADVFAMFDKNAETLYYQYDMTALTLLETFQIEGLRVLTQYGNGIKMLEPYLDLEATFSLFQRDGIRLEDLLDVFQAEVIAGVYTRFGEDGLKYLFDDPEIYFLFQHYGERLIDLANAKGPIVFTLVKKHELEFLELYYDDVLFTTLSRFGVDGLMALKTYRGKASKIFELLADDERFAFVLRTYGYQQIIPVLYYFYQRQQRTIDLVDAFLHFKVHQLFEPPESPDVNVPDEHIRIEYVSWALQRLYESGHSFLRQFAISDQGNVQPLPLVAFTNLLDIVFVGADARQPTFVDDQISTSKLSMSGQCERLLSSLQILGLLTPDHGMLARMTSCFALQSGLSEVRSTEGLEGLIQLDEYTTLMDRYGNGVVPFVARYGRKGIELLEHTDGEILHFSTLYGEELMQYILRYGFDVFTFIKTYGEQLLTAIRTTDGEILPYMHTYGKEVFAVLAQPYGSALITLCPVFGEDVLVYAARYPEDFSRYLFKYGSTAMNAFRKYDQKAADLARQYGDVVIYYLGIHGDQAWQLMNAGEIGLAFLEVLPEDFFLTEGQKVSSHVSKMVFSLLRHYPVRFHQWIGILGENMFSVPLTYSQIIFWTFTSALLLFILEGIVRVFMSFRE